MTEIIDSVTLNFNADHDAWPVMRGESARGLTGAKREKKQLGRTKNDPHDGSHWSGGFFCDRSAPNAARSDSDILWRFQWDDHYGGALHGAVKGKVISPTFVLPGVFRYSGEVTLTKRAAFSTYVGDLTATYYLLRIDTKHNQARLNWWLNGGRGSATVKLSGINYQDVLFDIESDGSHVTFQVSSGTTTITYTINAVSPSAVNSVSKFEMAGGSAAVQWVQVETLP
jgi:hypothetical protein